MRATVTTVLRPLPRKSSRILRKILSGSVGSYFKIADHAGPISLSSRVRSRTVGSRLHPIFSPAVMR